MHGGPEGWVRVVQVDDIGPERIDLIFDLLDRSRREGHPDGGRQLRLERVVVTLDHLDVMVSAQQPELLPDVAILAARNAIEAMRDQYAHRCPSPRAASDSRRDRTAGIGCALGRST